MQPPQLELPEGESVRLPLNTLLIDLFSHAFPMRDFLMLEVALEPEVEDTAQTSTPDVHRG